MSRKALFSLMLGLASPVGLVLTGLPALLIGLSGLREINQSEGRLRGRVAALTGMLFGLVASLIFVFWIVMQAFAHIRVKAEREKCADHLMYIGRAVLLYHDDRDPKVLPRGTISNEGLSPDQRLSWMVSILPYLNNQNVYDRFDLQKSWSEETNRPAAATAVIRFYCPSNPNLAAAGAPPFTHFVGLAGLGPDAASLPARDLRAGFFGYDREIALTDVSRGTSNTMIVTETASNNGPWVAGGPATVRSVDPASQPYFGPGRPFGGVHRHGLNILFADGHVVFAGNKMSPQAFEEQVRFHAKPPTRHPPTR